MGTALEARRDRRDQGRKESRERVNLTISHDRKFGGGSQGFFGRSVREGRDHIQRFRDMFFGAALGVDQSSMGLDQLADGAELEFGRTLRCGSAVLIRQS